MTKDCKEGLRLTRTRACRRRGSSCRRGQNPEEMTPPSEARSVLPRVSVIRQNMTQGLQTASLPRFQSVATLTMNFTTDKGSSQHVAVHQRHPLARASKAPAPYQSDHCADSRSDSEAARASSDRRSRRAARKNRSPSHRT